MNVSKINSVEVSKYKTTKLIDQVHISIDLPVKDDDSVCDTYLLQWSPC